MVSTGASGVSKVETSKSSGGQLEFSDIIGPAMDSKENFQELNLGGQLSKAALDDKKEEGVEGNVLQKPQVASDNIGVEDFEQLKVVGEGVFGKVFQVKRKVTSEIYAMKVINKDEILQTGSAAEAETDILTKIVHPFIVQLRYFFQKNQKLYLVMDFINGGELSFHLQRKGRFSEDLARVYVAEIISAVSYLHRNGIVHRDLKADNILLDSEGHVKLIDFGLAKKVGESDRSNPEMIEDWWSVGELLYEMFAGDRPQNEIIKIPPHLTSDAQSLLKDLMQTDPSKHLGSGANGSDDIKGHSWFKSIDWKKLEARQIQPTFKPDVNGDSCTANFLNFDEPCTIMSYYNDYQFKFLKIFERSCR